MRSLKQAVLDRPAIRSAAIDPIVASFYRWIRNACGDSAQLEASPHDANDGKFPAHLAAAPPDVGSVFESWRRVALPNFRSLGPTQLGQLTSRLTRAWRKSFPWFDDDDLSANEAMIFAVQTFAALVIRRYTLLTLSRLIPNERDPHAASTNPQTFQPTEPDADFHGYGWTGFRLPMFNWWNNSIGERCKSADLASQLTLLDEGIAQAAAARAQLQGSPSNRDTRVSIDDMFRPLIEGLFPPFVRKALGEFYTPRWMVRHTLDTVSYTGQPDVQVLDPTCGSGTFLCEALSRWLSRVETEQAHRRVRGALQNEHWPVAGIDLNPLAVFAARANYILAIAPLLTPGDPPRQVPVFLADAILAEIQDDAPNLDGIGSTANSPRPGNVPGSFLHSFDVIVGNPPWVSWETLTPEYRRATEPLWHRYGLFTAQGMQTILGHGKKDLAMLISYAVSDRFLKPGGRLAFIVANSLFRNHGAGQGFRKFQLSEADEDQLAILQVDDFSSVEPFPEISTSSCIFTWTKGQSTHYPVPYHRWSLATSSRSKSTAHLERLTPDLWHCDRDLARPSMREQWNSSWLIGSREELAAWQPLLRPSQYRAYEGVNTGGANGVYWFEVIERVSESLLRVRNMPACGKKALPTKEVILEAEFLYPLVRGVQMRRWQAEIDSVILFVQDPLRRRGIDPQRLQSAAPRVWQYLEEFANVLVERAAYRRFFQKAKPSTPANVAPFYSMFNVGSYTLSPYKVAWHRMKAPLEAAILGSIDNQVVLPQETHAFVPVDTYDHAVYLASLLNSEFFNRLAEATSQRGGKSFGSPHLLERIHVPMFEPADPVHQRLVAAGHDAIDSQNRESSLPSLETAAVEVFSSTFSILE